MTHLISNSSTNDIPTSKNSEMSETCVPNNFGTRTCCSEAFPARISPRQEREKESSRETEADSGTSSRELLAIYDPDTCCWKTLSESSPKGGGGTLCLERLPKSGMTFGGKLYALPMSEHLTNAPDGSVWLTPTCSDANPRTVQYDDIVFTKTGSVRKKYKNGATSNLGLAEQVKWPTPQARDWKGPSGRSYRGTETDLPAEVQTWPTPTARDWKDGTNVKNVPENNLLGRVVKPSRENGALNPDWVECLMGVPVGWTDPDGPQEEMKNNFLGSLRALLSEYLADEED